MKYHIIPVTDFAQNCSVVWCEQTGDAALIDPGGNAAKIEQQVAALPVKIVKILLTHGHLDHVGAAQQLAALWQVPIIGPHPLDKFLLDSLPTQSRMFGLPDCAAFTPDHWLEEGEQVRVGNDSWSVLHCPGHTPGHLVFLNQAARFILMGDVLFKGGVGRTDFPQGDHQALIRSIKEKLLPLGDDIHFLPGHGPMSTLGHERLTNPFLQDEPAIW